MTGATRVGFARRLSGKGVGTSQMHKRRILTFAVGVISACGMAQARVEAPEKSMVAWVFMNSVDYCNGCNVSDNSDETLELNYRRQIEDGVAVGARIFFLDAASGDTRVRTVGRFAAAARSFNLDHPDAPVCVAMLYQNTGYTETDVLRLFEAADGPDADSSAYCTMQGKPVVASYLGAASCEQRRDFYADTVLGTLVKNGKGSSFHWIHHQQQGTALPDSFTNWKDACAPYLFDRGHVPGWIEFYSGDPRRVNVEGPRKAAIDELGHGGVMIPGLPTSRASNCGEGNPCPGATPKSLTPDIRGMNGFYWLLMAWHAVLPGGLVASAGSTPLRYAAYTLGFAGDYGENASHSSALICEPTDLVHSPEQCLSLPAHLKAAIPATFFRTGHQTTIWTHRGFHRIDAEFWKWFRDGVEPPVTEEFVAWAYRQHRLRLPPPETDYCKGPVQAAGEPESDTIYITSYLASPAVLKVSLGDQKQFIELPARQIFLPNPALRQNKSVSYESAVGTPHFVLYRNEKVIAEWDGRLEITNEPMQANGRIARNLNTYADYHVVGNVEAATPQSQSRRPRRQ